MATAVLQLRCRGWKRKLASGNGESWKYCWMNLRKHRKGEVFKHENTGLHASVHSSWIPYPCKQRIDPKTIHCRRDSLDLRCTFTCIGNKSSSKWFSESWHRTIHGTEGGVAMEWSLSFARCNSIARGLRISLPHVQPTYPSQRN